ncbi:MAG: NAD(P)/FAD-dependent oxidoreductase [Nevskia sp.]|nr:NAD(P)/FAD-dependent oxidoreductase [Nevskia sp.]
MKPKLIVVGNGMASIRVVELLLDQAPDLYDISVFDGENHGSYNRILLSSVLAGEKNTADIISYPPSWYAERGIALHSGDPVVAINRSRRTVKSKSGVELRYDRLLIATGSLPALLPVPGVELPGVIGFRNLEDVATMLDAASRLRYAVVIGGGLLGIEAANGLSRRGMKVTLVHRSDSLLNQQLDAAAAALLRATLRERKLELRLNAETRAIIGRERVTAVSFKEGADVSADLVVMAVGIKPNIELAKKCGLRCDRAIVVDDTLQTFDPRIYAVGECVQHRGNTYGLVAPLWEQARVCAVHLAQFGHSRYPGSVTSAKLKVSGIDLFSTGDFIGGAGTEDLVYRDPRRGIYKRLVLKQQRLVGAVLYGDVGDGPWYFDLIKSGTDIGPLRDQLVFGKSYCEAA